MPELFVSELEYEFETIPKLVPNKPPIPSDPITKPLEWELNIIPKDSLRPIKPPIVYWPFTFESELELFICPLFFPTNPPILWPMPFTFTIE